MMLSSKLYFQYGNISHSLKMRFGECVLFLEHESTFLYRKSISISITERTQRQVGTICITRHVCMRGTGKAAIGGI